MMASYRCVFQDLTGMKSLWSCSAAGEGHSFLSVPLALHFFLSTLLPLSQGFGPNPFLSFLRSVTKQGRREEARQRCRAVAAAGAPSARGDSP